MEPSMLVVRAWLSPAIAVIVTVFARLHRCPFPIRAKGIQWFGITAWVNAMKKVAPIRLIDVCCIVSCKLKVVS